MASEPGAVDGPSDAAAGAGSSETSALDLHLAAADFPERICLVNVGGGGNEKWWPALRYRSLGELQEDAEKQLRGNTDTAKLAHLQLKLHRYGRHMEGSVAYLLGRGRVKRSLTPLNGGEGVESFFVRIHGCKAEYKGDGEWKRACEAANKRVDEVESDDDDEGKSTRGHPAAASNQAKVKVERDESWATAETDEEASSDEAQWGRGRRKRDNEGDGDTTRKREKASSEQDKISTAVLPAPPAPVKFRVNGVWGEYVGDLNAQGHRHGKGKITLENGQVYDGEWKNGKRDGEGIFRELPNGDWYEGEWKNDNKEGQGTYHYANGDTYEGAWKNDNQEGLGTVCWAACGGMIAGVFKGGRQHGPAYEHTMDGGFVALHIYKDGRAPKGILWSKQDREKAWMLEYGAKVRTIKERSTLALRVEMGFPIELPADFLESSLELLARMKHKNVVGNRLM